MPLSDYQSIMPIATTVSVLSGIWLTLRKIARDAAVNKKEQKAEILQATKEEISALKSHFEGKISAVKVDLKNFEANVEKDFDHVKETYNNEMANLSDKIESLREELRSQNSQIIDLLGKMIDKD